MTSAGHGGSISAAEVRRVTVDGLWLLVDGVEHALPFADFPWFRDATIAELFEVERPSAEHLRWPALDVDLSLGSILDPGRYPMVSRASGRTAAPRAVVREPTEPPAP